MNRPFLILAAVFIAGILFYQAKEAGAGEFETRYATVTYFDMKDLREFNNELYMGRLRSRYKVQGDTVQDEVGAKIDFIVERVMTVLDMYPRNLKFLIEIYPDARKVQQVFRRLYQVDVRYIAFYSPSRDKIFFSADNGRLRVVAHEIGHVVVENYFTISPPRRIHEVLAQFAEKHVTD